MLILSAAPVYAQPALPHAFYGTVTINGYPASIGTRVEARGTGVMTNIPQNPLTTTVAGEYGSDGLYLLVQGDISSGATITFYVNGRNTGETATFEAGGGPTSIPIIYSSPGAGGGALPPPAVTTVTTTMFGSAATFSINTEGVIQETLTATSQDGNLTMTIPAGTVALDENGNPLSGLTSAIDPSPPPPPEDANIIGLAYNFGPPGATFSPPITIKLTVDPATLPPGVAVEDLVLAYYDEVAGEWVELTTTYDPATNTFTADVEHFTTFAIIARTAPPSLAPAFFSLSNLTIQPAEVQPKDSVTITVSVANTGGTQGSYTVVLKINGMKEAEKRVTIADGRSETVSFTVSKEDAASYSVAVDGLSGSFTVVAPAPAPAPPPPPPAPAPPAPPPAPAPAPAPPTNWPLIGGIIAAVVIVGLLLYFLVVRRLLVRG